MTSVCIRCFLELVYCFSSFGRIVIQISFVILDYRRFAKKIEIIYFSMELTILYELCPLDNITYAERVCRRLNKQFVVTINYFHGSSVVTQYYVILK